MLPSLYEKGNQEAWYFHKLRRVTQEAKKVVELQFEQSGASSFLLAKNDCFLAPNTLKGVCVCVCARARCEYECI